MVSCQRLLEIFLGLRLRGSEVNVHILQTKFERFFNAGIIRIEDKYLICGRLNEGDIALTFLDKNFQQVGEWYHPPVSGITDPKIVKVGNNYKLCYSYAGYGSHLEYIEITDLIVDGLKIEFLSDTKSRQLTIFDYPDYKKGREKSWSPFSVNNRLYFVYKKNPCHQVIEYFDEVKCVKYLKDAIHQNDLSGFHKNINGNGNACRITEDLFITSFHTDEGHDRYRIGYYLFERKYPFRVFGIGKTILIDSKNYVTDDMKRGPLIGSNQKCTFVGSWSESIDDSKMILSIGVNDFYNHFIEFSKEELLEGVIKKEHFGLSEYSNKIFSNKKIELNITNKCNKNCFNCHQLHGVSNSFIYDKDMTPEGVVSIMNEITNNKIILEKIGIIGGEPTLNKNFIDIVKIIHSYSLDKKTKVIIYTNGETEEYLKYKSVLFGMGFLECEEGSNKLTIVNSNKANGYKHEVYYYQDTENKNVLTNKCEDILKCGLCISTRGIFICQKSYTMSRILQKESEIVNYCEITPEVISKMILEYCPLCSNRICTNKSEIFGEFWKSKFKKFTD